MALWRCGVVAPFGAFNFVFMTGRDGSVIGMRDGGANLRGKKSHRKSQFEGKKEKSVKERNIAFDGVGSSDWKPMSNFRSFLG